MLSINEIIRNTRSDHPQVYQNKNSVRIYNDSVTDWKAEDGIWVRTFKGRARDYKQEPRSNQQYHIEIDIYGKPITKNSNVWVTCNCPYFFFHCAWWLYENDATDADTGFGGYGDVGWAPKAINPIANRARVCKHILKALMAVDFRKLSAKKGRGKEVTRK